jgi:hypothetical protein
VIFVHHDDVDSQSPKCCSGCHRPNSASIRAAPSATHPLRSIDREKRLRSCPLTCISLRRRLRNVLRAADLLARHSRGPDRRKVRRWKQI